MAEMVRCEAMRVAAVTGLSGSGKTTLIEALIRRYVAGGVAVAAIKHTHHTLNEEERGDTARFRAAGAEPVIFAGNGEAILFPSLQRVRYVIPLELLEHAGSADVVLVEGFQSFPDWPRMEVVRGAWLGEEAAAAMLDRIWHP
jgi:molybdopterin-guanine dinucleotide biosynthesis adapter protein